MRWAIYTRNPLKSLGANVQGEMGSVSEIVLFATLWEEKAKKKNGERIYCSCHCAVSDCSVDFLEAQSALNLFSESALPPLTPGGFCLVVLKQHHEHGRWESTKIWWAPRCEKAQCGVKEESLKKGVWGDWRKNPEGHQVVHICAGCITQLRSVWCYGSWSVLGTWGWTWHVPHALGESDGPASGAIFSWQQNGPHHSRSSKILTQRNPEKTAEMNWSIWRQFGEYHLHQGWRRKAYMWCLAEAEELKLLWLPSCTVLFLKWLKLSVLSLKF